MEHKETCPEYGKVRDEWYFVMTHPDGDQHCFECHCSCDGSGPHCGHYAGCPGC